MKQEKLLNAMGKVLAILVVILMAVVTWKFFCGIDKELSKAEHEKLIINGSLEDLSLDRNDFKVVELKEFEGTNVFVLRLDERLFLGSYDEREDGIYVDVVKEI